MQICLTFLDSLKSFEGQKPRSVSEDRSRRRMNVRTGNENLRGFSELNTVRNMVESEDSGNSSLDSYNSDCRNQSEINRSDRAGGINKYWADWK